MDGWHLRVKTIRQHTYPPLKSSLYRGTANFIYKAAKTYKINQLFYEFKTWLGFVFKSNSSLVIHARSFYVFNKAKF